MTVRPVIFSGAMVQALLAGRKTQTRRLATSPLAKCQPGDLLYVRESVWQASPYPCATPSGEPDRTSYGRLVHYAADGEPPNCGNRHYGPEGLKGGHFAAPNPYAIWLRRPSIHMPRWASRLTLEVMDVRRQLLHEIDEADASAEGVTRDMERCDHSRRSCADVSCLGPTYKSNFCELWGNLHGIESWKANPGVVALSFKVHRANVDAFLAGTEAA